VIVTAGTWDCPWAKLLADGGRMVVPVIVATYTRSVTFTRHADQWDGANPVVYGFVTLQGTGAGYEQRAHIGGGTVHLSVEGGEALDPGALEQALAGARTEIWTGVAVADTEPFDTLNMHLATSDQRAGTIWKAAGSELVTPAAHWFTPALVMPGTFAYLTSRASGTPDEQRSEFGVHACSLRAAELAGQLARHVQQWDRSRRHGPGPDFTLYPADAGVTPPANGKVFTRRHVQISLTWP
jgi:protein-L-isoaspartate(D-aspartate) O-methyltransferase